MLNSNLLPPISGSKTYFGLNQVEGFVPTQEFTDDSNTHWTLVKASSVSTIDIPDPKSVQFVDCWNHKYPNLKTELYVYVVEGIKLPRVETEQPTRILYQWFAPTPATNFNPQLITEKEWLKANVYSAPIVDARMSKLKAICHIPSSGSIETAPEEKLLHIEELSNVADGRDSKQGR